MTRITLENETSKYIAEVPAIEMSLPSVISELVIPVLLAAGYAEKNITDRLGER
jgi:hypothetical protein